MRIEPKNEEQYQQFLADDKDSIWFSDHYEQIKEKYKGNQLESRRCSQSRFFSNTRGEG